ncbi:uncharacterized protein LOC143478075 isoform X2 [Brachyhypopomus gauderio]|uniref:uncharacterized protein LOC143478075 isoform X2 n=1 Tax=Brachyhypopomus gauderio TaxID=698409 RepID=UPI0040410047
MQKRKRYCHFNAQEKERKIPNRTLTRWKKRKIESYLHSMEREILQNTAISAIAQEHVSHSLVEEWNSVSTDTQDEGPVPHLPETTGHCTCLTVQDHMSHSLVEEGASIFTETQNEGPVSHLPDTDEQCTSSTVKEGIQSTSEQVAMDGYMGPPVVPVEDVSWLTILAFSLKHNVTGALMEDLLKLLKLHSQGSVSIPASKYMLEKPFTDFLDKPEYHHYCGVCANYLGSSLSKENELKCEYCSSSKTVRQSVENGEFFIYVSLKDQLKDLLENQNVQYYSSEHSSHTIPDITDGEMYKNLKSNCDSFLSLSFNCDGVPVFRSSRFSIWPLLCSVNEIPPEERDKHVLLCGLWFGSSKPNMTSFFKPFVEECNSLAQTGVQWQDPNDQLVKTVRVFPLCAICDAVARPLLQNLKQFNGEYGCGHCLHPGMQLRKGNGTARVYPCLEQLPDSRDHNTTVEIAEIAQIEEQIILGIKGPSAIADLRHFDIINGVVPDYMHCVLLGVCRQISALWFDSKNSTHPWYIGLNTARIDANLMSIKPPSTISRVPRSVLERKFWKAHEWQN